MIVTKPHAGKCKGVLLSDVTTSDTNTLEKKRMQALKLSPVFESSPLGRQKKIGRRLAGCASVLETAFDSENSEMHVKKYYFCHARICPVCAKRRAIESAEEVMRAISKIKVDSPEVRFLFVTFTIKNPHIDDLKFTLKHMSDSFNRLKQYPFFRDHVVGYLRKLEITLGRQGPSYCHPHYHCIIAVKPSYYDDSKMGLTEIKRMWAKALRIDYEDVLQVDVQDLKPTSESKVQEFAQAWEKENPGKPIPDHYAFLSAAQELVKYEVKSGQIFEEIDEWVKENNSGEDAKISAVNWIRSVEDQLSGSKEINSAGVFLDALKVVREEILEEKKAIRDGQVLEGLAWFRFDREEKRYVLSEHATTEKWVQVVKKIQQARIIAIMKATEELVKKRRKADARKKKKGKKKKGMRNNEGINELTC